MDPRAKQALLALPGDGAASKGAAERPRPEPVHEAGDFFGAPFRDFQHAGGVHVTGTRLWCDAARKNGLNFLSSARAGEVGKNRRVLCTEGTHRLATRGRGKLEALIAPYDQPLTVGELELSLHPAGHVLGAAQVRIVREGRVLVYAGEIYTRPSATALAAEPVRCDALALHATLARPDIAFPPREDVLKEICDFVDASLAERRTPVLLAQPVGVAQELVVHLGRAGYRLRLQRSIADVAKIYAALDVTVPDYKRFTNRVSRGEVLLFPPILRTSLSRLVPEARVALVGPRAVDAAHVHQLAVAGAFALSDVADRADRLAFVEATGAKEIYLTGGDVESFGAELRRRGLRVHNLLPREQLELF
jgi:putative mRNA 3-end processing factor